MEVTRSWTTNLYSGLRQSLNPHRIVSELIALSHLTKFFLFVMLFAQIVVFVFTGDFSLSSSGWIGLITSIATLVNLALVDQGYLSNYFWGLISTTVWFFVAIQNRLIGDMFSQGYYFFMQFTGMAVWSQQLTANKTNSDSLTSRFMSGWQIVLVTIGTLIVYSIVLTVSLAANGTNPYLDAALLPLGIVGQLLMTGGYASQWIIWLILDCVNVIIWLQQLQTGGTAALAMFILQIAILINSVYGGWLWYRQLHH